MSKTVSIVIPTKNEAKNLKILLGSLTKQTYKNFEVIINDSDNTNDQTPFIIGGYSKKLQIRHIFENKGLAYGRKYGAKKAKGDYLLHLDADMELTSGVLLACMESVKKGCDACVIPELSVGEDFWSRVKAFEKKLYIGDELMSSARFFKRSVYEEVGGHDERMVLSEDKDLHLKVVGKGYKVCHISEPLFHYEWSTLGRDFKKKFYYGRTAAFFLLGHPIHSIKQANLIFRIAYFRNWKKLIASPHLALGMFVLKGLETFAVVLGLMSSKLGFITIDPWKK
jgi:arabinofuranan 3-O-arabinosyltransferase